MGSGDDDEPNGEAVLSAIAPQRLGAPVEEKEHQGEPNDEPNPVRPLTHDGSDLEAQGPCRIF